MAHPHTRKLLTLPQAARWAARLRRRGEKLVATNGCFDLLHYGHVRYLLRAGDLGDRLIVGLNSDRSIRELKGPSRPLVSQRHRAAVLAALECIDAVVIFNDRRATKFLAAIKPAVYVKGGDYKPETLDAEEREVLAAVGTRVRILPLEPGYSTTNLIRRICAA
jgi:rfaE bifunctional protein nucleotidyltransferase chain/domain